MEGAVVSETAPSVYSVSRQLLVLTPVRLVLGLAGLAAALAIGTRDGAAASAFGLGALGSAVALLADRRFARRGLDAASLPPGAQQASLREAALAGIFPSTFGVTVLTGIALAFNRTLAGLLAGVLAGMAVASATAWFRLNALERAEGTRLYVEQGGRRRVFTGRA